MRDWKSAQTEPFKIILIKSELVLVRCLYDDMCTRVKYTLSFSIPMLETALWNYFLFDRS